MKPIVRQGRIEKNMNTAAAHVVKQMQMIISESHVRIVVQRCVSTATSNYENSASAQQLNKRDAVNPG